MLNPIVETVIGLVFVYLLLSMLCSTIQEWIAAMLALRANTLEAGVRSMLSSDNALVDRIYAHPLIKSLSRESWWTKLWGRNARPSYISAEVFAKAFLAEAGVIVEPGGAPQLPAVGAGANVITANTRTLLQTLTMFAPGEVDNLTQSVERWYDDAMDRVSGWYKRRAQIIILVIGAALAGGLNADTVMLAGAFWRDPTLRAATVDAAAQYVKTHKSEVDRLRSQEYPSTTPATTPTSPPAPEQQAKVATRDLTNTITDVQSQIGRLNVPFGWACGIGTEDHNPEGGKYGSECVWGQQPARTFPSIFLKILGLLATTLAISQGAPFWFDLLQKLVNLRLAGDAPDENANKTQRAH
jgi:hypothetical protein